MNFLDYIFPKRCVGCGRIGRYICNTCRKLIIPVAPNECVCPVCDRRALAGITHPRCRGRYAPDGLTSFFYYNTVTREAIRTIKYRFVRDVASEFVDLIPLSAYEIRSLVGATKTALVPIPLHTSRLRYRGFNQSETLGDLIAKRLSIPIRNDLLLRIKVTTPQVEKRNREKRLQNIHNVFSISSDFIASQYRNILLFDDVFTTGATMRAAAGVLKRHGVQFVWGVTMAR
jgi:competence protein ComFC